MKEEFRDYYSFPLKVDTYGSKVWDSKGRNAFDFTMQFLHKEPIANISVENRGKIVKIINGDSIKIENDFNFTIDGGLIRLNGKPLLMIRGWGMLTGIGGFNLEREKACEIQDQFRDYVLDKLQNSLTK